MHDHMARLLDGSRWLMEAKAFRAMVARAMAATPDAIQAAVAAYAQRQVGPKMFGTVAVIDACGPITYRSSWFSMYFGGVSIEDLQTQLALALGDPAVKTILFRWDSPGGCCEMVPEFADELFAARGQKPLISAADTTVCSAAYWLASQTDTIYATTSSRVGAIGVFTAHEDISALLAKAGIKITLIAHGAHKVDGNPYEPLTDAVHADIQEDVDVVGALFDAAVARGRGVSTKVVLDTFGQGDVFDGPEAITLGLADKKGTFAQVLARLTNGRSATPARAASSTATTIAGPTSDDDDPDDTMEPVDGECPDGYELGDDGLCHLIDAPDDDEENEPEATATATATAADDEAAIVAALRGRA